MNASIGFIKNVFKVTQTRLASLGFKKGKRGILTIKMSDDAIGSIGLNKATRCQTGFLEINPVVGVRNQTIERFVAELVAEECDELTPATLGGNIGYMMPANKYRPYVFSEDGSVETVVEELVKDVREYGLPFIRDHIDMAALIEGMVKCRFAVRFMVAYRIPAGLFLLRRMDAAKSYLNTELAKLRNQSDPASLRFKAFAASLAKQIREA